MGRSGGIRLCPYVANLPAQFNDDATGNRVTLDDLRDKGFDVLARSHALAVLTQDFPDQLTELCDALGRLQIPALELIRGGGGEAPSTQRLRRSLYDQGWPKRNIVIRKFVDDDEREATSHEIDHVRRTADGAIALEIEWNNKDPFFDRDLENFQRLHAEGVISVGIVVTRGASLQRNLRNIVREWAIAHDVRDFGGLAAFGAKPPTQRQLTNVQQSQLSFVEAWSLHFIRDKFGTATTHWDKLRLRIDRGVGNPCPLLLLGIPRSVIVLDTDD